MSIRYKLKSSAKFDTWCFDNGRRSVSLRQLRQKILDGKADQRHQQGFDLLFYDAVTELEYKGDDSRIASGSSVIVKRVPSWTVPLVESHIVSVQNSNTLNQTNGPTDKSGLEVHLMPDCELPELDLEADAHNYVGDEKLPTSSSSTLESTTSPLELKCPLCESSFKDAVKTPCCHQSFCLKCIQVALTENGMCPKCFSTECNVESVLPNLSLRLATESDHINEMLDAYLLQALENYPLVVDEEPGTQAKECPPSSSATGKGFNMESNYNHQQQRPARGAYQLGIVPCAYIPGEGGERNSSILGGYNKGLRNCYICGSPEHIMRDCPVPNPNPMFQPGNEVFHGRMPAYSPNAHMYNNHPSGTMMPFSAPLAVSHFNVYSENMRHPHHSNSFGLQRRENIRKRSEENIERGKK